MDGIGVLGGWDRDVGWMGWGCWVDGIGFLGG